MTLNSQWLERSRQAVWHPCTQMQAHEQLPLVPIERGAGVWLYDFDGKRYLDAVSSWWVNLFGHGEPRIKAAITGQLDQLEHVMLAGFTHRPAIELAERLAALAPGRLGHAFYASDGASATEIALKMSFHAWRNAGQTRKQSFVSLAQSYHGETLGALAVTDVALFRDTYAPLLYSRNLRAPSPDARLAPAGVDAASWAGCCADALDDLLTEHADEIAALILEPLVQGAAGMAMYHPVYLQRARAACDRHNVHLIADEIAVGFGRTGSLFACEQAGIAPDLLCLSKGITGGYLPLSVVLANADIYAAFYHPETQRGFLHSHSYTGNALACAAALAVLDIFQQDQVIDANRRTAALISQTCAPLRRHPLVRHFRQQGMIWAFDVATTRPGFAQRCFAAGLAREVLLRPLGNTVYFMPPYIISPTDTDHLVQATLEILDQEESE